MLNNKFIAIGEVVRTQGIKGKLKVRSFADLDVFEALDAVYLGKAEESLVCYEVASFQIHKGAVILELGGVDTMTIAEEVIGNTVFAEKDALEKLPEGEYYWFQIIGLKAYSVDGQYLGKIEEIFQTGSNDVYVVREGSREYLIPAIEEVVKEIDIAGGRLVISPIKGLLGEE